MKKIVEDRFNVAIKYIDGSYGAVDQFTIDIKDNSIASQRSKDDKGFPTLHYDCKEGKTVDFITIDDRKKIYFADSIISIEFSRSYEDNN